MLVPEMAKKFESLEVSVPVNGDMPSDILTMADTMNVPVGELSGIVVATGENEIDTGVTGIGAVVRTNCPPCQTHQRVNPATYIWPPLSTIMMCPFQPSAGAPLSRMAALMLSAANAPKDHAPAVV
jgi:hypothetical protein